MKNQPDRSTGGAPLPPDFVVLVVMLAVGLTCLLSLLGWVLRNYLFP